MENIYNKSVFEAQTRLLSLSRNDPDIPRVNSDGIYGSATTSAVAAFQKKQGLPVTGKIDYATWNEILRAYYENERKNGSPKPIYPFNASLENGSLSPGDVSDLVAVMQHMLAYLGTEFNSIGALPITGKYDDATENAVWEFQKRNDIPATGIADQRTLNLLSEIYEKYPGKKE